MLAQTSGSARATTVASTPSLLRVPAVPRRPQRPVVTATSAAEELLEILTRIEPGARVVRLPGGGAAHARVAAVEQQRVFVPDAGDPMTLTAAGSGALATSRRRVDATTDARAAARMAAISLWTRLTGGAQLRDRVAVVGGTRSLADHLGECLGHEVTYSMRIDESRNSRRPVLQLLDGRGRPAAYAHLGLSPAARLDLRAQAEALEVAGVREWQHLEVPRVLARTEWSGVEVLVTSALATRLWQGGARRRSAAPLEAMAELSGAWQGESRRLDEMAWTARQQTTAAGLRSRTARRRLSDAVDRLVADARHTTWPVGAWHGDWTPSHMARDGARTQLWSWARFETDVPMGLDPCHFTVDAHTRRDGFDTSSIHAGLREALRAQPGPGASVMGALYLLAVTSRELVLAEGPGGHRVADRAEVLLAALEAWLAARL